MLIFFITEVNFAFGFSGSDITRSQHVTKYSILCVCVCVCVRASYKIVSFHELSFGRIIWVVAAYIQPIRLRYIAEDLSGKFLCFSGWGQTSEG